MRPAPIAAGALLGLDFDSAATGPADRGYGKVEIIGMTCKSPYSPHRMRRDAKEPSGRGRSLLLPGPRCDLRPLC